VVPWYHHFGCNRCHLVLCEGEFVDLHVFQHVGGVHGAGVPDDALLVVPLSHDLRSGHTVRGCGCLDHRVIKRAVGPVEGRHGVVIGRERCIGIELDPLALHVLHEPVLMKEWMELALVYRRLEAPQLEHVLHVVLLEIADADGASCLEIRVDVFESLPGTLPALLGGTGRSRAGGVRALCPSVGPVNEEEIDVREVVEGR